ncbi:hypothetical protein D3C72_1270830 [compost metagenome]
MSQHGRQRASLPGSDKLHGLIRIGGKRNAAGTACPAIVVGPGANRQHTHALQQRHGELSLSMRKGHVDVDQITGTQHIGQPAKVSRGDSQRPLA